MRARYYNPEIRRFINQDIVTGSIKNSQSLNRYAYCQGNPVNYFDPFGLEPCEFFTGLGHGMLNLRGLIPGIGDVFDITNAIWYALDGNWGRCFESGIAALPFIGNFLPDRRTCDYVRRVLNIASYGGTAVLAGQGMVDGGQALWADISSGQCSGWSIFLGVANIGLNGATLFFSGKSFASETKDLNKMLKADGVYDSLSGENRKFSRTSGTLPEFDLQFFAGSEKGNQNTWNRNLTNTSDLNTNNFQSLKNNGVVQVNLSGSNRPLTSTPNSYYSTGNGEHIFVYDNDGKLIYDISSARVKGFKINIDPNSVEHYQSYKLNGSVPEAIKNLFGW